MRRRIPLSWLDYDVVASTEKPARGLTIIRFVSGCYLVLVDVPGFHKVLAFEPPEEAA